MRYGNVNKIEIEISERSASNTVKYQANLPEDIEQQMVFEWAATMEYRYPCLRLMYHVPNEASERMRPQRR